MDGKISTMLCTVLLCAALIQGAAVPRGSRCLCTKPATKLNLKEVEKLEVYPRSSTCDSTEYVVILKNRNVPMCVSQDMKEVKAILGGKHRQVKHIKVIHHQ